jgi:Mg-chelatase subunit ChlD
MNGDKIEQAKRGAKKFALSAQEMGYATGLAVFADRAAMIADPTDADLCRKIHGLRAGIVGSSTFLAMGLELSNKFLDLAAVVIVTDGAASDPRQALAAVRPLKARGVEIICIGTDDADRDFLSQLATRSDLSRHVPRGQMASAIADASRLLGA